MPAVFFIALALTFWQPLIGSSAFQGRNTIDGRVTTTKNQPYQNARVSLLNEGYSELRMVYTDSAGRYRFNNLTAGTFYVRVEPAGSDFERQTERVEVNPFTVSNRGGEVFRVDFVLRVKEAKRDEKAGASPGLVFYQDVPAKAKDEYLKGVKSLEQGSFDEAIAAFKSSVKIFPDYYDALEVMGLEYVKRNQFEAARPILEHAVEVNKDSWQSCYLLGYTLFSLNERDRAIEMLRRTVELKSDSAYTNMQLGIVLAQAKDTKMEAMQFLKKAIEIGGEDVKDAYLYLATLYSDNKQYKEAADVLDAYLKTIPPTEHQTAQRQKYESLIVQLREKANQKN